MTTQNVQYAKKLSDIVQRDRDDSIRGAEESQDIKEQALQDSLWRMEEANAMAKIKGMSKLAESANQL